ncbi:MAG: DUF86 domain-containing protein [Gammaproteobacteria bacterium]|jgi:uncharacterized protein YutE (UPF0331/DUF86 family)|nr:DUF86 domain-containing protein [Gammaproteobacteria bacterium]
MNETLVQKIQSCQRCIKRAREILAAHVDDFLDHRDAQDAAVLNLVRLCELSIDIANFIIRRDKLGIPASSSEAFALLQQAGIINHDMMRSLQAMVGFRNVAVHQYRDLDYAIVIAIIEQDIQDIIGFLDNIMESES